MTPLARSSARTWYGLVLFAVAVAAVVFCKPACVFRPDGSMYEFGLGADRSVFSFGVVVAFIAIVSAFMFAISDLVAPAPGRVGGGKARSRSIAPIPIPMFAAPHGFAAPQHGQAFAAPHGFAAPQHGQGFAAPQAFAAPQGFAAPQHGQAFAAPQGFAETACQPAAPQVFAEPAAPAHETSEQRRARIWG